jgi:uncharacterized membrane protein YgdD (TMEM256/DUF423 family)
MKHLITGCRFKDREQFGCQACLQRMCAKRAAGHARSAGPVTDDELRALMARWFTVLGALSAFIAVAGGAFGAHALKARLTPELLAIFEAAARYQMFHALALLAVAWACTRWPGRATLVSGWCFVAGTLIFCGSLYTLALTGMRTFGAVTPLGGVLFLVGWMLLAWAVWRSPGTDR